MVHRLNTLLQVCNLDYEEHHRCIKRPHPMGPMSFLTGDPLTIRVLHVIHLEKTRCYRKRSFQSSASSPSCARWSSLFWAKEHRGAISIQSAALSGSWEVDAPSEHCGTSAEIWSWGHSVPFTFLRFHFLLSLSLSESLSRERLTT